MQAASKIKIQNEYLTIIGNALLDCAGGEVGYGLRVDIDLARSCLTVAARRDAAAREHLEVVITPISAGFLIRGATHIPSLKHRDEFLRATVQNAYGSAYTSAASTDRDSAREAIDESARRALGIARGLFTEPASGVNHRLPTKGDAGQP